MSRHRWGVATLATAAFLWGVGALWTPAPETVGSALIAVAALAALALWRFGCRWRGAFEHPERARTRTSLFLYTTSLALAALFLAGLFLVAAVDHRGRCTPVRARRPARSPRSPAWCPRWPTVPGAGGAAPRHPADPELQRLARLSRLRAAREERYQRIRDLVAETDPDVVLLQEAWSTRRFGQLAERLSRELGLGYAYARANGSLRYLGFEEGLVIMSRYPISDVRRMALGPRTPPWEMRAALGAKLELPGGEPLEVWNTHLSHSDEFAREGQARSLASALNGLAGRRSSPATSTRWRPTRRYRPSPTSISNRSSPRASTTSSPPPPCAKAGPWSARRPARFGEVLTPGGYGARPEVSDHPALLIELRRRGTAS